MRISDWSSDVCSSDRRRGGAMFYEPKHKEKPAGLPYNPFKSLVVPRPIGWITTLDENGTVNLAPYSFFNAVSSDPPVVMFSSGHGRGTDPRKDSQRNAEEDRRSTRLNSSH